MRPREQTDREEGLGPEVLALREQVKELEGEVERLRELLPAGWEGDGIRIAIRAPGNMVSGILKTVEDARFLADLMLRRHKYGSESHTRPRSSTEEHGGSNARVAGSNPAGDANRETQQ